MGVLSGLFGKSKTEPAVATPVAVVCLHTTLLPRWDAVDDMGQEDKVSGFSCQACSELFSADEGRALRVTESDRVRTLLTGSTN